MKYNQQKIAEEESKKCILEDNLISGTNFTQSCWFMNNDATLYSVMPVRFSPDGMVEAEKKAQYIKEAKKRRRE